MVEEIRYVNNLGEEIVFGGGPWHFGETDLFDFEAEPVTIGGSIVGFERPMAKNSLTVILDGPLELRNRLADVTAYDRAVGKPGTLWACGAYRKCWIAGIKPEDWYMIGTMYEADLTVVADEAVWVRSVSKTLTPAQEKDGSGLDFPFDFPFDLDYSAGTSVMLENPFRVPAKCDIYIPGPCTSPHLIIGGNRYQVDTAVNAGSLLVIRGYGERGIFVRSPDGTERSVFRQGVREEGAHVFAEVPVGNSVAAWVGSYNIEVVLYEERDSPWWT
ncbi:hypothetical protein [Parvibacter caecicola]|uniref:hypothetical protein n=1 Tax=Parvibacter caecicola TaxID=747645 RepID=UPI00272F20A9|nr:hypothetical protein [Parvibacter caecicola]